MMKDHAFQCMPGLHCTGVGCITEGMLVQWGTWTMWLSGDLQVAHRRRPQGGDAVGADAVLGAGHGPGALQRPAPQRRVAAEQAGVEPLSTNTRMVAQRACYGQRKVQRCFNAG